MADPLARRPAAKAGDRGGEPARAGAAGVGWAGLVLVCATAVLAGVLELLLVPLYAGSVIVPVAVLFAVASNVLLPRLARSLVPRTAAAAAPFAFWLLTVLVFGVMQRPEGDVVLPGAPTSAELVAYGVMLGGAVAGTVTLVLSGTRPVTASPASSSASSPARPTGSRPRPRR